MSKGSQAVCPPDTNSNTKEVSTEHESALRYKTSFPTSQTTPYASTMKASPCMLIRNTYINCVYKTLKRGDTHSNHQAERGYVLTQVIS